ncbi:MAG: RHS repeat-associated core domain-containing protein, partial [Candidatus Acidiferrales bacterium]
MLNDGYNTMVYDAANRLLSTTNGASGGSYVYDGGGDRVEKTSGGATTVYIWSGDKVIAEYPLGATASSPSEEYIYSQGKLIATLDSITKYHLQDHLSIRMTTDANGAVLGQQGHLPFGELWYDLNTTTKWAFTDKERDGESGLDDFDARYYSSSLGRFVSADWSTIPEPVPYADFRSPQSLNLFIYLRNNPINSIDPDGHEGDDTCKNVKVEAEPKKQDAHEVQNKNMKDDKGNPVKGTGVEAMITLTVTVDGKPAADVKVTEANQDSTTRNGEKAPTTMIEKSGSTNEVGQVGDTLSNTQKTDGSKEKNKAIKAELNTNVWTSINTQTMTLTFKNGQTCSATSTRTLTNAGKDGNPSKYTLTTTQPVVSKPGG